MKLVQETGVAPLQEGAVNSIKNLREIIRRIESGADLSFVMTFIDNNSKQNGYLTWCTPFDAVALSALALGKATQEMNGLCTNEKA